MARFSTPHCVQGDRPVQGDKTPVVFDRERKQINVGDLFRPVHKTWVDQWRLQKADIVRPEAMMR